MIVIWGVVWVCWNTPMMHCVPRRAHQQLPDLFCLSARHQSEPPPHSLDSTYTLGVKAREPSITHQWWIGPPLITEFILRGFVCGCAGLFLRALVRMCWRQVKCIDYFNLPICESVILVALHSTGESLMGLSTGRLRPLPVQLTFNWNLAGEREEAGHGHAEIPHIFPQATDSPKP